MTTMVDLHCALAGKCSCPAGGIWVGGSNVVLVPKSEILQAGDIIKLVLTRSIYCGIPSSASYKFGLTALVLK